MNIIFTTAYKDISRNNWSTFTRGNEEYINWFKNLIEHIPYKLIVYIEDDVKNLLRDFKIPENIIFQNLETVDTFYTKYLDIDKKIMSSFEFQSKIPINRKDKPECLYSEYNLINHSKVNFVAQSKRLFPDYDFYAWIDFGLMNQEIQNIPKNIHIAQLPRKIIIHCVENFPSQELSEEEVLKIDTVYLLCSSYIIPNEFVECFESIYEKKLLSFYKKNLTDDDQSIFLQIYYDYPFLFHLIDNVHWFGMYTKLEHYYQFNASDITPLCTIMQKNKSDKGGPSWHNYTKLYNYLFKSKKNENIRLFEIGNCESLYGWSEYFGKGEIFGSHKDKDILFQTNKINTFYCDPSSVCTIKLLWENEQLQEPFQIMIEDCLNTYLSSCCFFENSIYKLAQNGYYIIEDIPNFDMPLWQAKLLEYKKSFPKLIGSLITLPHPNNNYDNNLLIFRYK